jgi:hypothetical protein
MTKHSSTLTFDATLAAPAKSDSRAPISTTKLEGSYRAWNAKFIDPKVPFRTGE